MYRIRLVADKMEVSTEFVGVAVGDKFSSFDTLSNKIKRAEDASFVQLYLRDSRTLEAAQDCQRNSEVSFHHVQLHFRRQRA